MLILKNCFGMHKNAAPNNNQSLIFQKITMLIILCLANCILAPNSFASENISHFAQMPNDKEAEIVNGANDGKTDDTANIQEAIDKVKKKKFGEGIVFLPSGRYLITRTILIPKGVRIFGVGPTRPTIVLGANTPSFQDGVSAMIVFTGEDQYSVGKVPVPVPNIVPRDKIVRDANSSTFYSAMSNVNIEIGAGNPAAIGVRFRMAQHAFLSHMNFEIGSGLAGVYQAGNVISDVKFNGGRYGVLTEKTSPAWQLTIIDSDFTNQRSAAIREHEANLTLYNIAISNTPIGIDIDHGYSEGLFGKNISLSNVKSAGVVISNEDNLFTQINFQNVNATKTPNFAKFRESGRLISNKAQNYNINDFTYGLNVPDFGQTGNIETTVKYGEFKPNKSDKTIRSLPPTSEWVNIRDTGVIGDGKTDDTKAIQNAIDKNRIVYFPLGAYRVSDTINLKSDSIIIGLHAHATVLFLDDNNKEYAGVGSPKPIFATPQGGNNIISGIGLYTGNGNPRAMGLLWKSGENSLVDDVNFMGGHSRPINESPQANSLGRAGDPIASRGYDVQHPSMWVTDGGGGNFIDIWTPNTIAQAGFYISNTKTPSKVFELSAEHHVRHEIVLDNVENWEFFAPQTEQEVGEGGDAVSTEIRNSKNILFANYHGYRVTRNYKPAPVAVKIYNSDDIRFRNVHINAESGFATCTETWCGTYLRASKFPFEDAIINMATKETIREREFARFDIPAGDRAKKSNIDKTYNVKKLEDGFYSISGAAVDKAGKLYFVEHRYNRIYSWSEQEGMKVIGDNPLDPVNLAIADSGEIMVLSSLGPKSAVYSFNPNDRNGNLDLINPTPIKRKLDARILLPNTIWINGEFEDQYNPKEDNFTTLAEMFTRHVSKDKTEEFVSKDGSLALPSVQIIQQGPPDHIGWRFSDSLDTYGFVNAKIGQTVYIINGVEAAVYKGTLGENGNIISPKLFVKRGGESVAVGPDGNIYVANGQIFVYNPEGKQIDKIEVPQRPIQLIFGGENGRTLFILSHHSLYSTKR